MIRLLALTTALSVTWFSSAGAITLARLSFADLVAQSDVVVRGRVADVHSQWTPDRHGIESLVTLAPLEYLKGRQAETVLFRTPGGQVGDMVNVLPGAPAFRVGDHVVLFLASRGPSIPSLVGLTQGVLRVNADPRSGELLATPPLAGLTAGAAVGGNVRAAGLTLSRLADAVRAAEIAR